MTGHRFAARFCAENLPPVQTAGLASLEKGSVSASSRLAMANDDQSRKKVDQFVMDEIDTVPHLEALLLFWNNRTQKWSPEDMARALYLPSERTRSILADLERLGHVVLTGDGCFLYRSSERDPLIEELDRTYRREVVRISNMIHSKPSASLREFARAFQFKKKERE